MALEMEGLEHGNGGHWGIEMEGLEHGNGGPRALKWRAWSMAMEGTGNGTH